MTDSLEQSEAAIQAGKYRRVVKALLAAESELVNYAKGATGESTLTGRDGQLTALTQTATALRGDIARLADDLKTWDRLAQYVLKAQN